MSKLVYTSNFPFDVSDWAAEQPVKVCAGEGCVMILTAKGEACQKITDRTRAIREDYWYDLKDIALSQAVQGAAIGLMRDGTCMIGKRALRSQLGRYPRDKHHFDYINNKVKSWKNIVQVACSDAFFALDSEGCVHYVCIDDSDYKYRAVNEWRNVVRIVAGCTQDAVFGITADGRVLAAGANVERVDMAALTDVTDIGTMGSECSRILYSRTDGCVYDLRGNLLLHEDCARQGEVFASHFLSALVRRADGSMAVEDYMFFPVLRETEQWRGVRSAAVGDIEYGNPYAVAIVE